MMELHKGVVRLMALEGPSTVQDTVSILWTTPLLARISTSTVFGTLKNTPSSQTDTSTALP
jgi:hypothetical protein